MKMDMVVDQHMQAVLEFMQANVPAGKLVGVAHHLPEMARLLWGRFPQEPCIAVDLLLPKTEEVNRLPQVSTESSPVQACEHDGSGVVAVCR